MPGLRAPASRCSPGWRRRALRSGSISGEPDSTVDEQGAKIPGVWRLHMGQPVIRTWLEMNEAPDCRPGRGRAPDGARVERLAHCPPALYRRLYADVGTSGAGSTGSGGGMPSSRPTWHGRRCASGCCSSMMRRRAITSSCGMTTAQWKSLISASCRRPSGGGSEAGFWGGDRRGLEWLARASVAEHLYARPSGGASQLPEAWLLSPRPNGRAPRHDRITHVHLEMCMYVQKLSHLSA